MRGNTKNVEQAKLAAQRLYKKVNFDGGNLQTYQLSSLMQQTYDFLKIPFKPTTNDLKQYLNVLDANADGAVSLKDLQSIAVNYLCGQGVLAQNSNKKSVGFQESQYQSSQNVRNNQYLNYGSQQNDSKVQSQGNNYETYGSNPVRYNQQSFTTPNGYNYQQQSFKSSGYQSSSVQTKGKNWYSNSSHQAEESEPQQQINSYSTKNKPYQDTVKQSQEHLASKQYAQSSVRESRSKYTETAQNYLNITRNLFKKYSNQSSSTITRDRVGPLLTETYGALGRKGYYPSEEDINVWMKLCDTNADGHVEQAEYEYFVIRALQRSGIQVNS